MLLSDKAIRSLIREGKLIIDPLYEDSIRENGVDMRIGPEIAFPIVRGEVMDPTKDDPSLHFTVRRFSDEGIIIPGNTSILLVTEEYIKMPDDVAALCGLRSSIARWGFIAAPTLVDAGFEGQLTIEVMWTRPAPVRLYRGIRFLHVVFFRTEGKVERPYSGAYQGQRGVTLPKRLEK
ncbi:dCTP deaminase [Candidatus Korarchaeum cryptofilum]|jgi:dCTP deaminase|uniref:dCTP deaminase n=2 Tax=Candidatus Korarchaeum cryptofilum TaxID=498846 RepID=DCD_KORCO|nr:dCTP deaminase [Candidatus Korarchaeum cryptofilum]B1L7R6.1 RecName: Full=dCTP deaminase; AltName: Full=Deoxycytidine triphosphate deaminase [Candidatus Korarchaeum cryptofilum OPF8]ACB06893.1 deoxycytidine triphosphate deaminase [Candidatus Korarchaeum cryptofilum OPF8]RSN69317.1 dCTP deaminase [Candidatus Korarchaeum cryptofilum]